MKYEDTLNCVRSLQGLEYDNFKIFIIDNHSKNDSYEQLRTFFPNESVIRAKSNQGYAAGNKIGVDYALAKKFDLVWVLNNDCCVRSNSLTELVASYKRNGDALYSNLTLMSENPDIIHYAGTYDIHEPLQPERFPTYDKLKGKLLSEHVDELIEKPARIYGHSMLIPVEVIKKHGFMETDYFMFCEETDYTLRLDLLGVKSFFVPKACITHISTSTFQLSPRMKLVGIYYSSRNQVRLDKIYSTGYLKEQLKKIGGWKGLIKFVLIDKWYKRKNLEETNYYHLLGIQHGIMGKKGKILNPEELL